MILIKDDSYNFRQDSYFTTLLFPITVPVSYQILNQESEIYNLQEIYKIPRNLKYLGSEGALKCQIKKWQPKSCPCKPIS